MFLVRLAAAASVAFLALFGPATAAFAVEPPSAPYVTATAVSDHTVRLDWYLDDAAPQIEIAATDSAGGRTVNVVAASAGSATFTDLPGGSWRADVTAIDGSQRSESVSVYAQVTAPAAAPAPRPTETLAPPTTTAATVDFQVVPGPDGSIEQASVRLLATGLAAGSTATVAFDGAALGTAVANADGAIDQSLPLPAGVAPGTHRLDFAGTDSESVPVTSTYSFDVAPPAPAEEAPVAAEPETAAPTILETSGDEAVPYLIAGTVAATVATGAAAAAASTMTTRVRRIRVGRLLDAEFSGLTSPTPSGGAKSFFSDFLTSLRSPR